MSLGEEIRIVRQKSFYSQEAFAKELHVALSTVNRWEMNRICPNLSAMKSINGTSIIPQMGLKHQENRRLNQRFLRNLVSVYVKSCCV